MYLEFVSLPYISLLFSSKEQLLHISSSLSSTRYGLCVNFCGSFYLLSKSDIFYRSDYFKQCCTHIRVVDSLLKQLIALFPAKVSADSEAASIEADLDCVGSPFHAFCQSSSLFS